MPMPLGRWMRAMQKRRNESPVATREEPRYISPAFESRYGLRLAYDLEGDGLPCLVCTTGIVQQTLSKRLRDHLQLVFVRFWRGEAYNTRDVQPFDAEALAEGLEIVRAELGFPGVAVLGHGDMGSLGAMAYGAAYPQNTSHVILIATNPRLGVADWRAVQRMIDENWGREATPERKAHLEAAYRAGEEAFPLGLAGHISPGEVQLAGHAYNSAREWYDMEFDPRKLWERNCGAEWLGQLDETGGKGWYSKVAAFLECIEAPVFIATGKYDFTNPPVLWDGLRERLRDAECHLFTHSGHYPQYEEQDLFDATLIAWLGSTRHGGRLSVQAP